MELLRNWSYLVKPKKKKRNKTRQYGTNPRAKGTNPRKKKTNVRHYIEYIKSKDWTKRKIVYYRLHEKSCRACGATKNIHLHHTVYRPSEFGRERDSDLVPLCGDCHGSFHKTYGKKGNMSKETKEFISLFIEKYSLQR